MRRRLAARLMFVGACVGAILTATACGPDRGPVSWIDERAAVVHCTSSGRDRMPPVLLDLPAPYPDTGLYARRMDPMALDELGIERDRVACAMLLAPTSDEIEEVGESVTQILSLRREVSRQAIAVASRCTCEVAGALGMRDLIEGCAQTAAVRNCQTERYMLGVQAAVQPLVQTLGAVELPLVHWRLVGRTDREGWFAEHHRDLLERHGGGSTVFVPGQAVPTRYGHELINRLLELEDVVAVARQDGGRSLLVVREVGSHLVLDHFSYAAVEPKMVSLLPFLDAANVDEYIELLEKPQQTRKLGLDPAGGNLVEVDRSLLERVDELVIASSALAGGYDPAEEERSEPEPFVERITLQAPFGKDGEVLRAHLELTEAGTTWAQTLSDDLLTPTLRDVGLSDEPVTFAAPPSSRLSFVLRGTVTDEILLQGIHRMPELMRQIEMTHPSTVQGKRSAWRFELPASTFGQVIPPTAPMRGLRETLAKKPFVVEMTLDADRDGMTIEARPK